MKSKELTEQHIMIKEKFFEAGNELLRPVRYMINDTYPAKFRDKDSPEFRKEALEEYNKAMQRAQFMLYERRNEVQDKWLPRYELFPTREFKPSEDWQELHDLVVEGSLDRLCEMICNLSPLLIKLEYVEGCQTSVLNTLVDQKQKLSDFLKKFSVKRKNGIPSMKEIISGEYES